ncbi:hypothetical protein VNO77_23414 [Canavalia gladiata]|uniref:Uncharacterized protein n=1 Tax=Canavalia gladiata TaxID=3824 RepID=A0AAN9L5R9_CANGL
MIVANWQTIKGIDQIGDVVEVGSQVGNISMNDVGGVSAHIEQWSLASPHVKTTTEHNTIIQFLLPEQLQSSTLS